MKKLFLLLAVISISLGVIAQKGKVTSANSFIDQGMLDKAKESIDQALTHEKSKAWPNTFFVKGRLCQAIYQADNPKFNSYYPDPLAEAYASYEKAMELDPKGGTKKKVVAGMVYNSLAMDLYNQGSKKFEANDYEGALKAFAVQIKITESDLFAGGIDTGMYFNAGLAAQNAKKYDEAIKYFEKCGELKYLGINPYFRIYECFLGQGDTIKAEAYLLDLPNKFPGDNSVNFHIADLYLKSNKPNEALKYLNLAKAQDADNYSLWYASGITYLNLEKFDEAIAELEQALKLKSDLAETHFAMGASYINKAQAMFLAANEIMDVNKYDAAITEANAVYAKALPYMQKAYEIDPNDKYTMQSLRELYYRLRMMDEYNTIKAKLEALEGQQ
ncbi:MAG: tetratricopeptide repeat protein [Bacteroidales bacterium]|nr:tetratricopeptide repeat protein [Bacteroidales bacterium]